MIVAIFGLKVGQKPRVYAGVSSKPGRLLFGGMTGRLPMAHAGPGWGRNQRLMSMKRRRYADLSRACSFEPRRLLRRSVDRQPF